MATKLQPDHNLIRYVPWGRLRKDEEDNVLGVTGAAFALRPEEEFLSATWAEHFSGSNDDQIVQSIRAIRSSRLKVTPKSGFAVGTVDRIDGVCTSCGHRIRFLHEPEDDNEAHAALRRWPREADDLFDLLAEDAWSRTVLNKDIPP